MSEPFFIVNKPQGWTPLQAIQALQETHPELKEEKLTYAGRLDPMATGVLPILIQATEEEKREFTTLDKTYEFGVLFGVETDSYDLLGKVVSQHVAPPSKSVVERRIRDGLYAGSFEQPYPPYSSKVVDGKPLWLLAKQGRLPDRLPHHEVAVSSFEITSIDSIGSEALFEDIQKRIRRVKGDFRQKEIIALWEEELTKAGQMEFPLIRFEVNCSSGTYVRQMALELGRMMHSGAVTHFIRRTRVGSHTLSSAIELESFNDLDS